MNQCVLPTPVNSTHAYITVPITLPGSKPGEANQTVHIQMLNPNPVATNPKLPMQFHISPTQDLTDGNNLTVLTVAFNANDGGIFQSHGLPEGVTLLTALQPNDLQTLPQPQIKGLDLQQNFLAQKNQVTRSEPIIQNNRVNVMFYKCIILYAL